MADSIFHNPHEFDPQPQGGGSNGNGIAKPWKSKLGFMPYSDLDVPGEEFEFVVDEMFSSRAKSLIIGKRGSGKTFLATHLAHCIPIGRDFFGHKITKPGPVVLQCGEGEAGARKRLRAYRAHYGVPDETMIPLALLRRKINLFRADGGGNVREVIDELKGVEGYYRQPLVMFIIDTFSMATIGADEISGRDMGIVMENMDRIRDAVGCAVMAVHHLNAAGNKARGHTSIEANFDECLIVEREDDATKIRIVTIDKVKDGEDKGKFRFDLMRVETGRIDKHGAAETSCVCLPVGVREEIAKRDAMIGAPIRKNEEPVFRAFWTARQSVGVMATDAAIAKGAPADSVVVTSRQFCDMYASQRMASDDDKPDDDPKEVLKRAIGVARKAWERNSVGLIKYGILGFSSPYIWWRGKAVRGYPETIDNSRTTRGQQGAGFQSDVDF